MPGTPIPVLFFGRKDTAAEVLATNEGFEDGFNGGAGDAINLLGRTARIAPAGVMGECIFTRFWIMVEHTMAVTLQFTPILDGHILDGTDLVVPFDQDLRQTVVLATAPTRLTEKFEFVMQLSFDDGTDPDAVRTALRGTWFQLVVATSSDLAAGDLIIHQTELEYEVVRESQAAE